MGEFDGGFLFEKENRKVNPNVHTRFALVELVK